MYNSYGFAEPMTLTEESRKVRIWVHQDLSTCAVRIAQLDTTTPLTVPNNPLGLKRGLTLVNRRACRVNRSTNSWRGCWNGYVEFESADNGQPVSAWPDGLYAIDVAPDWVREGEIASSMFIIRRSAPNRKILYKFPTNTWNAYSMLPWDGHLSDLQPSPFWSIYRQSQLELREVPIRRPGVGWSPDWATTHAMPLDNPLYYNNCAEGHGGFLAWLQTFHPRPDYATDLDLHQLGYDLLKNYRLLICSGHEEYWTRQMRQAVAAHINNGGNVAFLSGNNMGFCSTIELRPCDAAGDSGPLLFLVADWSRLKPNPASYPAMQIWGPEYESCRATGLSSIDGGWFGQIIRGAPNHERTYEWNVDRKSWLRCGLEAPDLLLPGTLTEYEFECNPASIGRPAFECHAPNDCVTAAFVNDIAAYWFDPAVGHGTPGVRRTEVCYFQPFGSLVNVGTTEWLKHFLPSSPPAEGTPGHQVVTKGIQTIEQASRNIVNALARDRSFIGIGPLSSEHALDILYDCPLEHEGGIQTIASAWMLDRSSASFALERGKWLTRRQDDPNQKLRAFAWKSGATGRLYYQQIADAAGKANPAGAISAWEVDFGDGTPSSCQATASPLADTIVMPDASGRLIGAAKISRGETPDLVLGRGNTLYVCQVEPEGKRWSCRLSESPSLLVFGFARANGQHRASIGFVFPGSKTMTISLLSVGETGITLEHAATFDIEGELIRICGFADVNGDGQPELLFSLDEFTIMASESVREGSVIAIRQDAGTPLSMKAGCAHDPPGGDPPPARASSEPPSTTGPPGTDVF